MNIVITGASKGLGKAIALVYANEAKTIKDLQLACHVHIFAADLSVKEGAEEFAEWCLTFGKIDILVNNAGQYFPGSIIEEQEGNLEKLMQVNVYSAYYLTRKLVPRMISAKSGHIFNMCSVASIKAFPNGGSYCISKFALLGFSKSLREELRQDNIKITSILPGAAYTDAWIGSGVDPMRIMEANDIAQMVLAASKLSSQACVEEIVLRPQLGDL